MVGISPLNKANVLNINNDIILDNVIATDTNAIMYAFGYPTCIKDGIIENSNINNLLQNQYYNFFDKAASNDTIITYTHTNICEISTLSQKLVSKRKAKEENLSNFKWKDIYSKYDYLKEESNNLSNIIISTIEQSPYFLYLEQLTSIEIINLENQLLLNASIDSNDATIIANALAYKINSILTNDMQYANVRGINIYTSNPKMLIGTNNNLIDFNTTCKFYKEYLNENLIGKVKSE
ncbi:hypothetical protein BFT35_03945 [Thermoanaerobacterium thermosaccharolyticum]|uniref:hypothetical protein n=1 Tax=Thermoanaerobacterium thermosaccharolyticum TaxID=1517 RepID=UPI000C087E12|nr:hypothetical protein [Thermoanaerobacterium thermosaccharolyticum]PHO07895.1 hypothetical protein BFT35_03945 [Thermoanaerobacterium thermosaccharolyticum]